MKLIFLILLLTVSAAAGAVEIIKNGKAAADIALPEKPVASVKFAAKELQKHIRLMTGVKLPVTVKGAARKYANRIHLGYGAAPESPKSHTWRIKAEKNDLYLCGNDLEISARSQRIPEETLRGWRTRSSGSLFAVYDFLDRELGFRWIRPGDGGIFFTPSKNITVKPFDRESAPKLMTATIGSPQYRYVKQWHNKRFGAHYAWESHIWALRHRLAVTKWFHVNHAFTTWWKRHGKKHPEYFALLHDGTRRPLAGDRHGKYISMCISSDALLKQIISDYKRGYGPLGRFKEHDIISICENDTPGMCTCKNCRAWDMPEFDPKGSPYWEKKLVPTVRTRAAAFAFDDGGSDLYNNTSLTDRYAKFWLRTHKELSKINPDVKVMGYAYANTTLPPRHAKLHDKIIIGYVGTPKFPLTEKAMAKTRAEWDGWVKTGCLLQFRPNTTWSGSVYPLQYWKPLAKEYHRILQSPQTLMSHFDCFRGELANQGPMWYVLIRLTYRSDLTVEQIADEYFSSLGRPGKYIREYFDFWEKISNTVDEKYVADLQKKLGWRLFTWNNWDLCVALFTPEHFAQAAKILEKAERAAVTSREKANVRFFKLGLEHARLTEVAGEAHFKRAKNFTMANQKDFEKKRAAVLAFRKKYEKTWISNMPLETHRDGYGYTRSIPQGSKLKDYLDQQRKEEQKKARLLRAKKKMMKK